MRANKGAMPRWKLILICSLIGLAQLATTGTAYYFLSPFLREWGGLQQAGSIAKTLGLVCIALLFIALSLRRKRVQGPPLRVPPWRVLPRRWVWVMVLGVFLVFFVILPASVILDHVSSHTFSR